MSVWAALDVHRTWQSEGLFTTRETHGETMMHVAKAATGIRNGNGWGFRASRCKKGRRQVGK